MSTRQRHHAGSYSVTDGTGREVLVLRNPARGWWIAAASWDRYSYSDPHLTLAEATAEAQTMLAAAAAQLSKIEKGHTA